MNWFPLFNLTHYSLTKAYTKPIELVKKCAAEGYAACGLADYKTISGAVEFFKACKEHKVKPVIGCSFDGFALFALNKDGWYDLIEIVSAMDADYNYELSLIQEVCNRGNLARVVDIGENLSPRCKYECKRTEAMPKTYYVNPEDAQLHRILLCAGMKTTLAAVTTLLRSTNDFENRRFFEGAGFEVPSKETIRNLLSDTIGCENLNELYDLVVEYNILSNPILPRFPTPNGESEEEYLRELCERGWESLLAADGKVKTEADRKLYSERLEMEFAVIKKAKLFGYFLIVQDIINFVNESGWIAGPGRGSAAGCLISYLIGITQVDPIEFDLIFERFYNEGRNTEGNISLPDIDMDVPSEKRDEVIAYMRRKYGPDNVSQMLTFGRLQGRSVMKEVLRVNAACGFAEMNEITKYIPDEAAISDQLQEMDPEDRSIIRWALLNNAKELADYCALSEDGKLTGDFAEFFEQAIRMEGTFKTQGKHAAGVVISAEPLYKMCPMMNQRSGKEKIAGLEMEYLEAIGGVKLDVLGLSLLDRIMFVKRLANV
jgi:DNA polymerase-3 subunit alpha